MDGNIKEIKGNFLGVICAMAKDTVFRACARIVCGRYLADYRDDAVTVSRDMITARGQMVTDVGKQIRHS
ncbi:unnamed protein product [Parnassius apollo]|uniref:(apollo) hypothetical protein n=1 Tax=Parnassius apollo TaxID=110799 RepID=A0A8S3XH23_PARAO|nr:unnamed protein product [Parnassius apollo]